MVKEKLTINEKILFIIGLVLMVLTITLIFENKNLKEENEELNDKIDFLKSSDYGWINLVIQGTNFSTYLDSREYTPSFTGSLSWWMYCRKEVGIRNYMLISEWGELK